MNLTAIRQALTGIVAPLGQVTVYPGPTKYDQGKGFDRRTFIVEIVAANTERLDELLDDDGDQSVTRLLEADRELGGLVPDLSVVECSGYLPGPEPAARWTVEVLSE